MVFDLVIGFLFCFVSPKDNRGFQKTGMIHLFSVLKEKHQKIKKDSEKGLRKSGEQACLN